MYSQSIKVSALSLLCAVARVVKEKRNNMLHSPFSYKETVIISVFSLVLFSDSFSWKLWPHLDREYLPFAFPFSM